MAIYELNGFVVGNADMVWLNSGDGAELLVDFVNEPVSFASAAGPKEPQIGELGRERCRYLAEVSEGHEVRMQVEENQAERWKQQGPWREEEVDDGHLRSNSQRPAVAPQLRTVQYSTAEQARSVGEVPMGLNIWREIVERPESGAAVTSVVITQHDSEATS